MRQNKYNQVMKKCIIILLFSLCACRDFVNETIEVNEVKMSTSSIFLKEVTWGLTGDSKMLYVGASDKMEDTLRDMFFYNDYFFYKVEADTLYTYTMSEPKRKDNFSKLVPMKNIVLDNIGMSEILGSHKEKGLKAFVHSYDKSNSEK